MFISYVKILYLDPLPLARDDAGLLDGVVSLDVVVAEGVVILQLLVAKLHAEPVRRPQLLYKKIVFNFSISKNIND